MNSKSLRYNNIADSKIEKLATAQISIISGIFRKVFDFLTRSEIDQAQASYKMKRKHEAQGELHQDIVDTLPIEEKLKLGMYHFMR